MKRTALLSLLITTPLLLTACSKQEATPAPDRPVKLATVSGYEGVASTELAGEVRARVESNLGFRVGGKIIARAVETGQRVHKGQELARLDPRDFQLSDQSAQSQRIAAQAQLDNARAEYRRFEELSKKSYISATDLERKRVELTAAEAQFEQATSGLSLEKNRLADTVLRADTDGIVTAVMADVGEVVGAGQPAIRVAQDGQREIEVEFPEDRIALAKQAKATVTLWARANESWPASLRELSAAADPVTRTFRARYTVKAPADALILGQSAALRLQIPMKSKQAIRLPTTAIFGEKNQTKVWVFDPKTSTVKAVPVQVASVDGNDVLIAGLAGGTQVVVAGVHVLTEGQKVVPFVSTPH